jgi:mono/diheme cytochrome c family protein
VAITVSGLEQGQEIAGQVGLIINAYAGNTEVDFEPSRAETPQPIPTWAWLIFLAIVAWTMFYVLNPTGKPAVATASTMESSALLGQRVFADTCAKCHQENGESLPDWGAPPLKDSEFVLEANPTSLVTFIVAGPQEGANALGADAPGAGRPRLRMPAWGTRLTNDELVAVVNHIRSSWGNQAPLIQRKLRRAPDEILRVNSRLVEALQKGNLDEIDKLYSKNAERQVRLVRPEDRVDVSEHGTVVKAIGDWLKTIQTVNSLALTPASYAVIETGGDDVVYGDGTMLLTVTPKGSTQSKTYQGSFVRVYVREFDKEELPAWRIAFDFARVPMPIGCEPPGGNLCPPAVVAKTSFQDVVNILKSLGQQAPNTPHRNFWDLPYKDFKDFKFPYPKIKGSYIRLINPGVPAGETNLIKALRDGNDILVEQPDKPPQLVKIDRMPKGTPPLSAYDISRIEGWISLGMPEFVGQGTTTNPPPNPPAMDGTTPAAGADDFASIQEMIRGWSPKAAGSPHGKFWEKPYAEFVDFAFPFTSDKYDVKIRMIEKGKGADSNLIRALTGRPLVGTKADGTTVEISDIPLMPPKGKKPPKEDIDRLARWIDAGAPEKRP